MYYKKNENQARNNFGAQVRLFVERREQAASGRQPCAAADTKSAGDSARLIYDVLQPYKSCSDEASAPTTAGRFSLINKT